MTPDQRRFYSLFARFRKPQALVQGQFGHELLILRKSMPGSSWTSLGAQLLVDPKTKGDKANQCRGPRILAEAHCPRTESSQLATLPRHGPLYIRDLSFSSKLGIVLSTNNSSSLVLVVTTVVPSVMPELSMMVWCGTIRKTNVEAQIYVFCCFVCVCVCVCVYLCVSHLFRKQVLQL